MSDVLVVQVSDLHVGIEWAPVPAEELHRQLAASLRVAADQHPAPALVVASGDLTDHGRAEEVAVLAEMLGAVDAPVLALPGNHDDRDALVAAGLATTDPVTGRLDAVVDLGPLRVVALDTLWPGHPPGRLDPGQLDWLDAALAVDDRPVLLVLHHPPVAVGHGDMDGMRLEDPGPLGDVVGAHPHVVRIACGHLHRTVLGSFRGVPLVAAPSLSVQLAPAFGGAAGVGLTAEPPGYVVHRWHPDDGLSSHVLAVSPAT